MKISPITLNSNKALNKQLKQNKFMTNAETSFKGINFPFVTLPFTKTTQHSFQIPKEHLAKEMEYSEIARENKVNTPEISNNGEYIIHGEYSNIETNPIRPIHIKNMLDNIINLDRAGIYHGDIEKSHVFYDKNGSVQIDCFRFGSRIDENEDRTSWEFPSNIAPTNLYDFENNCLGDYLSQINDEEKEKDFIKQYLKISRVFHKRKADDLKLLGAPKEQIRFEELQAKLYQNPDDDIVRITRDRIKFKAIEREAFTEWDEGNGACGHDIDEQRTVKGINLYFDAWHKAVQQEIDLFYLQQKSQPEDKKELLSFMNDYTKHWDKNYSNSIKGMANWTINPENRNNKSYRDIDRRIANNFNYLYRKATKTDKLDELELFVETTKNYYNYMLLRDEHL